MALSQTTILAAARSAGPQKARDITEARNLRLQTAFLCHSHKDVALAPGIAKLLRDAGWSVYVDWADPSMPETSSRVTAQRIKDKIVACQWFLFLATSNSMASRWCPWEIGYADGRKPLDQILVIPTTDTAGVFHGSEYLQLYRKIDLTSDQSLAAFDPDETQGRYVRSL
jgi:hypothetical protein